MLLVLFAHPLEAQAVPASLNAKLVITGMGPENAARVARQHAQGATEIWNLGIAGALTDLPLSSLHPISEIHSRDAPPITLGETGTSLYTSQTPVWGEKPDTSAQLVDMEGYAIAQVAREFNLPCRMWKIVSDHTEEGGSARIRERLPTLSQALADHLIDQIEARG